MAACSHNGNIPRDIYFTKDGGEQKLCRWVWLKKPAYTQKITKTDSVTGIDTTWFILNEWLSIIEREQFDITITAVPNKSGKYRSYVIKGTALIDFDGNDEDVTIRVHQEK